MLQQVSDVRSNPNDQIDHAARVIGRSKDRAAVFKAICRGKKSIKTVKEIRRETNLSQIRVLQEGRKLSVHHIVHQTKVEGQTAYKKDDFYSANKKKILAYAKDPKKLASMPTKTRPHSSGSGAWVAIRVPRRRINAKQITIDDIESFSKIRKIKNVDAQPTPMLESKFKEGIKRILHERGQFKDWGGERNDLLTTRLQIAGKRRATAFAFKGRGRRGKLTPASMGKNGDQIQRLFHSPAEVFLVQYWNQIEDSVIEQMADSAKLKSVMGDNAIYFGVIDGDDSNRIIKAYPKAFL